MSTTLYLGCIEHDPPVISDGEVGHRTSQETIDKIKYWLSKRDTYLQVFDDADIYAPDFGSREQTSAVFFFAGHRTCRLAIRTEYDTWIDLGMGLPAGVRTHDMPAKKVRLIPNMNDEVPRRLEEIRERDKNVIARMKHPTILDPLFDAEHDRRYLLSLFEE